MIARLFNDHAFVTCRYGRWPSAFRRWRWPQTGMTASTAKARASEFLRLIDESFAFFHPNPIVPNVTMFYRPDWDTFEEGAGWAPGGAAILTGSSIARRLSARAVFLHVGTNQQALVRRPGTARPPMSIALCRHIVKFRAGPEGVLPECASPGGIRGCQHIVGEGNVTQADWALTSTAAEVMLQAELLLVKRDMATIREYLPKMEKASAFLESRRDPKNGLLLAGPCATMQGADYTGYRKPDGTFGRACLAVLAVNYCAALERMIEYLSIHRRPGETERIHKTLASQLQVAGRAAHAGRLFRQLHRARRHEARSDWAEAIRLFRLTGERRRRRGARCRQRGRGTNLPADRSHAGIAPLILSSPITRAWTIPIGTGEAERSSQRAPWIRRLGQRRRLGDRLREGRS